MQHSLEAAKYKTFQSSKFWKTIRLRGKINQWTVPLLIKTRLEVLPQTFRKHTDSFLEELIWASDSKQKYKAPAILKTTLAEKAEGNPLSWRPLLLFFPNKVCKLIMPAKKTATNKDLSPRWEQVIIWSSELYLFQNLMMAILLVL